MEYSEIQSISIVGFLSSLGVEPAEKTKDYFKYFAPGRDEKYPSLTVYIHKNDWYDYGQPGSGGDIGKLVQYLYKCDASMALSIMNDYAIQNCLSPCSQKLPIKNYSGAMQASGFNHIEIKDISHWHLRSYLLERGIAPNLANTYLKEANYITGNGKQLHSLAFRNDHGGYVLRHKGQNKPHSTKPAYLTTIPGKDGKMLNIFEGVFDFLSYLTINKTITPDKTTIVLNSLSNLNHAIMSLNFYCQIHLYLDNDQAGDDATILIKSKHSDVIDHRDIYLNHKDFNEYLIMLQNGKKGLQSTL